MSWLLISLSSEVSNPSYRPGRSLCRAESLTESFVEPDSNAIARVVLHSSGIAP
ncbi:hypothetical protein [Vacuolonema iberomarrocanum]|uniref:hypothetical protein n=1 Tax=Vacuolonema iberomarrocanum TaxID=3454632 RepID=UPI0019E0845D|nr:hypothetical protein [filamentous cyanobacterium LEGE 07170]